MTHSDRDDMLKHYPAPINVVRKDRFDRLTAMMAEQDCQALVVAGSATVGRRGNLRFLSNFAPATRYACALFTPAAPPRLLVSYPVHVYWAASTSWIEDIQFSEDFAADSASYLQSVGCSNANVGVSGTELVSCAFLQELTERLPAAIFKSVDAAFSQMRMKKTPLDLQFVQLSADLADAALDRLTEVIKPGVSENDLFAEVEWVLRKGGAEGSVLLITSTGRHTTPLPAHRKLQVGDVVVFSPEPIAPGGFIVQAQRTFSLGKPSHEVQQTFDFCRAVEERTRDGLLPGNTAAMAAKGGLEVFQKVGGSQQSMILGHGIGIDMGEAPRVSIKDNTVFEPDMVVALHPSIYKDTFGVCVGNTYRITPQGPKSLFRTSSDLIVL